MTVVRALLAGRRLEGLQAADLSEAMRGIDGAWRSCWGGHRHQLDVLHRGGPQKPGSSSSSAPRPRAPPRLRQKIGTDYSRPAPPPRPVELRLLLRPQAHVHGDRGGAGPAAARQGASEIVLGLCGSFLTAEGERELLDAARQKEYADAITEFASEGLRTIGIAYRDLEGPVARHGPEAVERDLTLVAIVGIKDPVRAEVPQRGTSRKTP
eukprot:tig00000448_g905.t1